MLEIFKEPFMQRALIGGILSSGLCAYLGVFVILKRIVFMTVALAQIAALGISLGLFIGLNPDLTGFILTMAALVLFWFPFTEKNISRESLLGFSYCLAAAFSIILIAKNPLAEARGLNLISGNLLYITWQDIKILGLASFLIIVLHVIFFKKFIFVAFDKETALTTGLKANMLDFFLYITIGIMISLSIKICGVIFVFASLIIPAMTGLLIARRMGKIFVLSSLVAVSCLFTGLWLSYKWDLPSGPAIVSLYGILFIALAGINMIKQIYRKT